VSAANNLDPQRSAAGWWRTRQAETPALAETTPTGFGGCAADGVDLVIIDTRPSAELDASLVAAHSELILVPTRAQPSSTCG
jgi:chromosome partitioning protein